MKKMKMADIQEAYDGFNECKLVFVYGTLKRGFVNHEILKGSEFIGEHVTDSHYDLVNSSMTGGFPLLVSGTQSVKGEVYRIDNPVTMVILDTLESHPHLYRRELIYINELDDYAWIYFFPYETDDYKATIHEKDGYLEWNTTRRSHEEIWD